MVPHLFTVGTNKQIVQIAKQLLKIFPKYDGKKFANVITGDETWGHYFEPFRKVSNKIWVTKNNKRPDTPQPHYNTIVGVRSINRVS